MLEQGRLSRGMSYLAFVSSVADVIMTTCDMYLPVSTTESPHYLISREGPFEFII